MEYKWRALSRGPGIKAELERGFSLLSVKQSWS